jgi:hypothetical protein
MSGKMDNAPEWRSLLDRLIEKCKTTFGTSVALEDDKGTKFPTVWALALLARTISNIEAARILLDTNHPMEARTLVRCCWENFFCTAAIAKTGDAFLEKLDLDHGASQRKQAQRLRDFATNYGGGDVEVGKALSSFAEVMEKEYPKAAFLNHQRTAEDGTVGEGYVIYNVLSNDAAHPSITSLNRHILSMGRGNWTISANPPIDQYESIQTLQLACSAVLGVCVAFYEVFGGGETGETLASLGDEFTRLTDASKAAEKSLRAI